MSNFRQHLHARMNEMGKKCQCIRCREIGTHIRKGEDANFHKLKIALKVKWYKSSGGDEAFLSFESEDGSVLMGFCRLRLPPLYIKPEERQAYGMRPDECFLDTSSHAQSEEMAKEYE